MGTSSNLKLVSYYFYLKKRVRMIDGMHLSSKNWLYSEKISGCSRIRKSPHQSYFTIAAQLIGFSVTQENY